MVNGVPHGPWEYFREDGELKEYGSYDKGVKVGLWHEPD